MSKSPGKNVVLLWCVLGMYTCARFRLTALGSIFVKSYALGLFCRLSYQMCGVFLCVRIPVHNLSITGARSLYCDGTIPINRRRHTRG